MLAVRRRGLECASRLAGRRRCCSCGELMQPYDACRTARRGVAIREYRPFRATLSNLHFASPVLDVSQLWLIIPTYSGDYLLRARPCKRLYGFNPEWLIFFSLMQLLLGFHRFRRLPLRDFAGEGMSKPQTAPAPRRRILASHFSLVVSLALSTMPNRVWRTGRMPTKLRMLRRRVAMPCPQYQSR